MFNKTQIITISLILFTFSLVGLFGYWYYLRQAQQLSKTPQSQQKTGQATQTAEQKAVEEIQQKEFVIQKEEIMDLKKIFPQLKEPVMTDIIFSKNSQTFIARVYDEKKETVTYTFYYIIYRDGQITELPSQDYLFFKFSGQPMTDGGKMIVFGAKGKDGQNDVFINRAWESEMEKSGIFKEGDVMISPDGQTVVIFEAGEKVNIFQSKEKKAFAYPISFVNNFYVANNSVAFIVNKTFVWFKDNSYKKVAEFSKEIISTDEKGIKGYGDQSPVLTLSKDGTYAAVKVRETADSMGIYLFDNQGKHEKYVYRGLQSKDFLVTPLVISENKQKLATQMGSGLWVIENGGKVRIINDCAISLRYEFIGNDLFYSCLTLSQNLKNLITEDFQNLTQNLTTEDFQNLTTELRLEKNGETIKINKEILDYQIFQYSNFSQNGNIALIGSRQNDSQTKNLFIFDNGKIRNLGEYQFGSVATLLKIGNNLVRLTDQNEIITIIDDGTKVIKIKY